MHIQDVLKNIKTEVVFTKTEIKMNKTLISFLIKKKKSHRAKSDEHGGSRTCTILFFTKNKKKQLLINKYREQILSQHSREYFIIICSAVHLSSF